MNYKPERAWTISLSGIEAPEKKKESDYFNGKTDREVWKLFRQGHEGAFRFIYNSYLPDLFRYGSHFTKDRELIKDCIHDLFVELRQGKSISDTDSIKFYLLKAFRWKIRHMMARKSKFSVISGKEDIFHVDVEVSFETILINVQNDQEAVLHLNKALSRLSARQKEALYHFYHQDLTYDQVAQIMKLSNIKSARNLIYKALDALKVYYLQIK